MVCTLKDRFDYIYGFIEFQIVDYQGQFKDNGAYIYIQDLWIHPTAQGGSALKKLIKLVNDHPFSKDALFVYWDNLKNNERKTPSYPRKRLAKLGEYNGQKIQSYAFSS